MHWEITTTRTPLTCLQRVLRENGRIISMKPLNENCITPDLKDPPYSLYPQNKERKSTRHGPGSRFAINSHPKSIPIHQSMFPVSKSPMFYAAVLGTWMVHLSVNTWGLLCLPPPPPPSSLVAALLQHTPLHSLAHQITHSFSPLNARLKLSNLPHTVTISSFHPQLRPSYWWIEMLHRSCCNVAAALTILSWSALFRSIWMLPCYLPQHLTVQVTQRSTTLHKCGYENPNRLVQESLPI